MNLLHGPVQDADDHLLCKGLVEIIHDAKPDSLLRVIELVIGAHNNKDDIRVEALDFLHRLDPIDPRHLNIHKGDIRLEGLR